MSSTAPARADWYDQSEGNAPPAKQAAPEQGGYAVEASPASDPAAGSGLGIGMKLGYGVALGDTAEDSPFDEYAKGAVQTEFALSYGITPSVILGGYVGLGFGLLPDRVKDNFCIDDVDCSIFFLTAGMHGEYRILPGSLVNPWVGANFGMEWATFSASAGSVDSSTSLFGIAFGPSLGVDFELRRWGLGPFFSYQAGKFLSANVSVDGEGSGISSSGDIDNKAFHGWLSFGARARYTFAR